MKRDSLIGRIVGNDPSEEFLLNDVRDRVAIIDATEGTRLTYGELSDRIDQVAFNFRKAGIENKDRIALVYPNRIRYITVLFGSLRIGAVPVPFDPYGSEERLRYMLNDSDPKAIVADTATSAYDRLRLLLRNRDTTIFADGDTQPPTGTKSVNELFLLTDTTEISRSPPDHDDPALQLYTSGSTGRPKGVVLDYEGIDWNTRAFVDHLELDSTQRSLVVTPLHHKNAMTGAVKPMLEAGGSIVILREFDAETAIQTIDTYDVTYLTGVPTIFKRLVGQTEARAEYDTSSLRWASVGSAPVSLSLVDEFESAFEADLLEVYGLTEGGPVVTHHPRSGSRKPGSAGTTLPGVKTIVVDPVSREPLPPNEPGELLVASPGVGEYYNRPDETEESFERRDGTRFLRTEDQVYIDEDGYHYIIERLDEMLIVGGVNIYPAEVEDTLQHHDAVTDVAVVGVPHEEKGEAPVAFVVTSAPVSEKELKQFAIDQASSIAHPRRVFFCDSLPLTGAKKVDTKQLEEKAKQRIGVLNSSATSE